MTRFGMGHVLKEGWTYLASVMDLCRRKIIGYAYRRSMTAELAVQAVKNACMNVKETQGFILHSDLGSPYTSQAFEGTTVNEYTVPLITCPLSKRRMRN